MSIFAEIPNGHDTPHELPGGGLLTGARPLIAVLHWTETGLFYFINPTPTPGHLRWQEADQHDFQIHMFKA